MERAFDMTNGTEQAASSRTALVLDPDFVDRIEDLALDEVRHRRDLALAEREYQSYLRRLIQVRQDILQAERDRRASGGPQPPLVDRLRAVLSEGPHGTGRGEMLRLSLPEEDLAEAERRADASAGDLNLSDPESIDDVRLAEALDTLAHEERKVSDDRVAVLHVHDRLQEELKRRYRSDPSTIPTEP
jgi:hypothetical protein